MDLSAAGRKIARFGLFEADLEQGVLTKRGLRIRVQDQPFQVLVLLLQRPGEVITREQLRQKLWAADTYVEFDDGLNTAIKKLRTALSDDSDNPRFIETVPRRGYRFLAPVILSAHPVPLDAADLKKLPETSPEGDIAAPQPSRRPIESTSSPRTGSTLAFIRRRGILLLAALATLLLVTGIVIRMRLKAPFAPHESTPALAPAPIRSIAVLPLENLTGDPGQQYFADGMTDALITSLAQIGSLRVISRTSAMHYQGSRKTLPEIAKELGVDAVVEGSVVRSANRIRIDSQLIQAFTDRHVWAKSYERDLQDVLVLQGDVARAIASEVQIQLTPKENARLGNLHAINTEAYEAYLKGRHIMRRGGLKDVQNAIDYFQSGLAKDPNNALIYTGLADAYIHRMSDVHESPVEAITKARAATMKALELDDSLAEAHTSLASIKLFYDWDWAGAEVELKRAMELNPGYAQAYRMYGGYLTIVGRHSEALPYFENAHRLDPLFERNYMAEGFSYFMAHKYDEAIEHYRKAFEIEPDPMAYFGLVLALAEKGDYAAAISEGKKAIKLNDSPLLLTSLASAYARAGRRADSNRILQRLEEISKHQGPAPPWHGAPTPYVCPYEVAGVYAQLGDKNRAFKWLDKARRSRSCMYYLRQDPRLDSIHSDPRFQDLLTKMKFPQ
jgi:TolB-like protein/DNA-binding winged helix-turn-helix (wHTH) protein/Tfp pilus assembly protein PilF